MTLRVSGKNLDIGEALRAHVASRIDAAVEKYAVGQPNGHVTIEPEGSGYRADCTLHLASGVTLQVEAEAQEPYASFNRAADRIEKRLRRYHRRVRDHHAGGTDEIDMEAREADGADLDADQDMEDAAPAGSECAAVIAETMPAPSGLTVAGAVLELDARQANVLLFKHPVDGHLSLVYRRTDGLIGWVDRLPT